MVPGEGGTLRQRGGNEVGGPLVLNIHAAWSTLNRIQNQAGIWMKNMNNANHQVTARDSPRHRYSKYQPVPHSSTVKETKPGKVRDEKHRFHIFNYQIL